jgi:hypothetical protein
VISVPGGCRAHNRGSRRADTEAVEEDFQRAGGLVGVPACVLGGQAYPGQEPGRMGGVEVGTHRARRLRPLQCRDEYRQQAIAGTGRDRLRVPARAGELLHVVRGPITTDVTPGREATHAGATAAVEQLEQNLAGFELWLPDEVVARLEDAVGPAPRALTGMSI